MPAPQSLDALRRLIAANGYWNPNSPQYEELQRQVREGFGRLYPANLDATNDTIFDQDRLDDRDEIVRQLRQRHDELEKEYLDLSDRYAPVVPELDNDGNLLRDYVPTPPEIRQRIDFLDEQKEKLKDLLQRLGAPIGIEYPLNQ